ncbi:hypothetical protein M2145_002688 [Lachnospiraceae bacterium PF1-21]|uniref:nucleotidyl transferase AbiEii/AbiGii toxin family protein n=1 Tax=Ohessyouella blattaphilus TaxID=2949333 RepID=UPI003E222D71
MVQGLEKFKEYFRKYNGQYVFIGGTACDIILGKEGIHFRQTKDLDMVLIIEALNDEFINRFVDFVEEADYEHINKGSRESQFYRFDKPRNNQFPYMIELFSRKPDYLSFLDVRYAPIHVSENVISLSAILLDEEYYSLLTKGTVEVEEVSVLNLESLILFKMKAWLDLSERKRKGEVIDSKSIKKHRNDVLRLAANIDKRNRLAITGTVKKDVLRFLEENDDQKIDLTNLGIRGITFVELFEVLRRCYDV